MRLRDLCRVTAGRNSSHHRPRATLYNIQYYSRLHECSSLLRGTVTYA